MGDEEYFWFPLQLFFIFGKFFPLRLLIWHTHRNASYIECRFYFLLLLSLLLSLFFYCYSKHSSLCIMWHEQIFVEFSFLWDFFTAFPSLLGSHTPPKSYCT